jgi:hypothetical protein
LLIFTFQILQSAKPKNGALTQGADRLQCLWPDGGNCAADGRGGTCGAGVALLRHTEPPHSRKWRPKKNKLTERRIKIRYLISLPALHCKHSELFLLCMAVFIAV